MEKWIEKVENRLWTFHVKVLCLHLCREIMASVLVYSFHWAGRWSMQITYLWWIRHVSQMWKTKDEYIFSAEKPLGKW